MLCLCFSVFCSGQSKLDIAKKRLENRAENSTTSENSDDMYYDDSEEKKEPFAQKIAQFLFIELIAKPIYHGTKYVLVGDAHNVSVYNPTPYANNTGGEYISFDKGDEGGEWYREGAVSTAEAGGGFKEVGDDAEAVKGVANVKPTYLANLAPAMLVCSKDRKFDYARAGRGV